MSRATIPGRPDLFGERDPRLFPHGLLTPREVFELFDAPICRLVTVAALTPTELVGEDGDRAVLVLSATTATPCWVAPSNAVPSEIGSDRGIQLEENAVLVWTLAAHGPLAQFGWHAWGTIPGAFVYTIQLRAPRLETYLKGGSLNRAEADRRAAGRLATPTRVPGTFGNRGSASVTGRPDTTPGLS